jgi:hypothetical protein
MCRHSCIGFGERLGSLLQRTVSETEPLRIISENSFRGTMRAIWMGRDEHGRECFFFDEPVYGSEDPNERWVKSIPRHEALALIVIWSVPDCLRDDMLVMFKKNGMWS